MASTNVIAGALTTVALATLALTTLWWSFDALTGRRAIRRAQRRKQRCTQNKTTLMPGGTSRNSNYSN